MNFASTLTGTCMPSGKNYEKKVSRFVEKKVTVHGFTVQRLWVHLKSELLIREL